MTRGGGRRGWRTQACKNDCPDSECTWRACLLCLRRVFRVKLCTIGCLPSQSPFIFSSPVLCAPCPLCPPVLCAPLSFVPPCPLCPPVITSGDDDSAAAGVRKCYHLRHHPQPHRLLLQLFDKLMMLVRGQVVYFGKQGGLVVGGGGREGVCWGSLHTDSYAAEGVAVAS